MNYGDEDVELTSYHEAGHAVIAYALGGTVESVQLGGEADEHLPDRFGDCRINWGPVADRSGLDATTRSRLDPQHSWQIQREVMTILAGPVAEMIYSGEPFHPALFGPWKDDWARAWATIAPIVASPESRTRLLEQITRELHQRMKLDSIWAPLAAVADELQAHEYLDQDQLDEILGFWFRQFE